MDILSYILSKKYTDNKIAPISSGMTYKGNVTTKDNLPTINNKKGDVWTVADTGNEFVWTLDSTSGSLADWQQLGGKTYTVTLDV